MTASSGGRGSPRAPVPNRASTIQSTPLSLPRQTGRVVAIAEQLDGHTRPPQDLKVGGSVAGQLTRIGPYQHADLGPAQVEVPGHDKPIAGIVSLAAADGDPRQTAAGLAFCKAAEEIHGAAAGVFHEHQTAHAVFLDRPPIDLAGLLSGDGWGHRYRLCRVGPDRVARPAHHCF